MNSLCWDHDSWNISYIIYEVKLYFVVSEIFLTDRSFVFSSFFLDFFFRSFFDELCFFTDSSFLISDSIIFDSWSADSPRALFGVPLGEYHFSGSTMLPFVSFLTGLLIYRPKIPGDEDGILITKCRNGVFRTLSWFDWSGTSFSSVWSFLSASSTSWFSVDWSFVFRCGFFFLVFFFRRFFDELCVFTGASVLISDSIICDSWSADSARALFRVPLGIDLGFDVSKNLLNEALFQWIDSNTGDSYLTDWF